MSQENNSNPPKTGGQGRQGGKNHNRNHNQNRNPNRNRKRNRPNQRGGRPQGNRPQGNRPHGGNRSNQGRQSGGGPRKVSQKPMPLTLWEKILKFFGLYKEPTRPPRRQSAAKKTAQKAAKSNTRNARSKDASIKATGRGAGSKGKDFPVETPRLYLGNLSYDASENDLEELFKGVGTVQDIEIIYNRHTHRSKGYGFLTMLNVEEAKRAVEVLHDAEFMGRNLIVNGAKAKPDESSAPKEDRPPRERKPADSKVRERKPAKKRGEKRNNPARLHLDNLSFDVDESALEDLFKGVGNVRKVELVYNSQTHKPKGFGFVEMQKSEDAKRAIEVLHDQPFMGRKLVVKAIEDQAEKPAATETAEVQANTEAPAPVKDATEEAPTADSAPEQPAEEAKSKDAPAASAE